MIKLTLLAWFWTLADPSSGTDLIALLSTASGPVFMAVAVVGVLNEWWFPGKTVRRIVAERDALLTLALGGQDVGQRALTTAEIIAKKGANQ